MMIRSAVFAVLLAFSIPISAHEPAVKAAVAGELPAAARPAAAAVDAFHAALRNGDRAAASSLIADDALIFEQGGAERSKAEYESHHLGADMAFAQAVASAVTRRMGASDGAMAWIASEGRITGTYKGKAVDRIAVETMVLRRVGDEWKIVHIHWSSAAK